MPAPPQEVVQSPRLLRRLETGRQEDTDGTETKKWGPTARCGLQPKTQHRSPSPKWPLRAKLGKLWSQSPRRSKGQPHPQNNKLLIRDNQCAEGQQGPGLQRDPPWFPRLGELPIEQTRASISKQDCSPGRNSWHLQGKAVSVQTMETNDGNKSHWCQKDMEIGKGHIKVKSLTPGPAEGRG